MLLVADSGSTKTHWVLIDSKGIRTAYTTIGYNPYFINSENIYQSLSTTLINQFDNTAVSKVFFYGAGCSTKEKAAIVNNAFVKLFPKAKIFIGHDLLGAAKALMGNRRGFAAILGTGSNTGIYNGEKIEKNIDSLGYILGDEGSGSYIGKKIIRDFMRGQLPPELDKKFKEKHTNLSHPEIFDSIFNKPLPNRFLASFCTFATENKNHVYISNIVSESFSDFFKLVVSRYSGYERLAFNCVGSVGFAFKELLQATAATYKMKTEKIIQSPIEELANYHFQLKS